MSTRDAAAWAGTWLGPGAWGVSTQLNFGLAGWACHQSPAIVGWIAIVLVILALVGAAISWRARIRGAPQGSGGAGTVDFAAMLSAGVAVLFALVILAQSAAGFVFHGCER
jgi:hypothetical protein